MGLFRRDASSSGGSQNGRAGRAQEIVGYDLGAGPSWAGVPLVDPDGPDGPAARQQIAEVAADLTTDAEGAARLEQELLGALPGLLARPCLLVAVWVPDPIAGVTQGMVTLELLVGDGTTIDGYEAALDPGRGGQQVTRFETYRTEVPAGPCLVVDAVGSEGGGPLEHVLSYVVFPDGTDDGVSLTFATTALHLVDDLAVEAREIAESLVVELGATPAG